MKNNNQMVKKLQSYSELESVFFFYNIHTPTLISPRAHTLFSHKLNKSIHTPQSHLILLTLNSPQSQGGTKQRWPKKLLEIPFFHVCADNENMTEFQPVNKKVNLLCYIWLNISVIYRGVNRSTSFPCFLTLLLLELSQP